jgi:hypothetical protein
MIPRNKKAIRKFINKLGMLFVNQKKISSQKNIFVVLGMPRSGTSAVARGLKALGVNLGEELIPARASWNAKGYFEDKEVVHQINGKVLDQVFDKFESIQILDHAQLSADTLQPIRSKAINLIKQRFGQEMHWGFKDPRTARLLPFWQSIFSELNLQDHYVIVLRNPLASAHSFHKLTKIDLEKGLLLWLAHLIPAVDETMDKKRIVVSYDLMLANPLHELQRMQSSLKIESAEPAELETYAKQFLDKNLQHYDFSYEDLKNHPATSVMPIGLKVYDLLLKLAKDEMTFADPLFLNSWTEIKKEFAQLYPLYCYMDNLLRRNKQLERTVRTIKKSLPWKMVYPLRIIDNKLREIRKWSRGESQ